MMAKRHSLLVFAVVRHSILLLFISSIFLSPAYSQIWTEDFNSYPDATTQGPPKWTTIATDCDDGGNLNLGPGASQWGVWSGVFSINDIEGAPCCPAFGGGGNDNSWLSEVIDISGYCNVSITFDVSGTGDFECDSGGSPIFGCQGATPPDNSHDQIVSEYSLNSGGWTQFGYVCGMPLSGTISVMGLNGNTLQFRFFAANKSNNEYYYIDNIVVNGTAAATPTFNAVGPLCENDPPFVLPTTSTQGINGTWNPASINPTGQGGNTITATFTPTAGQCALPTTMMVTINSAVNPLPNPIGPFCTTDPPASLPTNLSGINGNWTGQGVIANTFDPISSGPGNFSLTFTPTPGQCANTASLPVMVTQAATPMLGSTVICNTDPPYDLTLLQDPFYQQGTWSGTGVIGTAFNPSGLSGAITITFTSSENCVGPANTNITVNTATTPAITGVPASICENENAIVLPTPQGGFAGNWSGNGVTNNSFDPTGLSGSVTLVFTPNAGLCANPATTSITVNSATTPTITGVPASICETENAISLPTPQDGFAGNWTGNGVTNNSFDPTGLSGSVTLTFTPNAGLCADTATTSINVSTPTIPAITGVPDSICETGNAISLPTTQSGFVGNWSGSGVASNSFDPTGLSGSITLTFAPNAGQCADPATTSITVNTPATPQLNTTMLCQNGGPYDLTNLIDPNYPAGTWSGPGVSGGNFNPAGQNGNVTLAFVPTANCTVSGTTMVTVFSTISFTNLMEVCDLATQTYEVSFTIIGGTAPYTVDGVTLADSTFTSTPIPSGTSYSFDIDDANSCGPVTVTGSQNCSCVTDAGTMNFANAPLLLCINHFQFSVPFKQDEVLDSDDTLQFVLLDGPNVLLANILATSNSAVIQTPPGLVLGQTYYVSAIAGNDDGTGNVDFNDPCFSFSQAIPIVFYLPTVQIGNDASICASDCYNIPVQFTGIPPFYFEWNVYFNNILVGNSSQSNLPASSSVQFCPADFNITNGVVTIEVTALEDGNSCGVSLTAPTINITVGNSVVNNLSPMLCPGESVVVNNTTYNEANPTGTEFFPGGSASGCDSTVNINLAFFQAAVLSVVADICPGQIITVNGVDYDENNPTDTITLSNAAASGCDSVIYVNLAPIPSPTTNFTQTLCTGGSITVNGIVYDENNPSGVEVIIAGAANGCDSAIVVNLSFNSVVTSNISPTLCQGGSVTVNGTVYNAASPSGMETMPGASYLGCDSVAMVSLSFYQLAVGNLNPTLCQGGSITVGGTVFNQSNPSGSVVIPNGSVNGCDSTVNVSLSFYAPATGSFSTTLCPNGGITLGGTVFNQNNPSGSVVISNGSVNGCDSTMSVSLSFYPPVSSTIDDQLCTGGSITVNGTVYNEANPSGTEVLQNASTNGCDSTININLTFGNSVIISLDSTLCLGEVVVVNGEIYSATNPTGSETIPNGSYLGCDSTVNVGLSFFPDAVGNITDILQMGGFIVVNGTIYDAQNPSGTEVFAGASYTGCDSTVVVNLSFEGQDVVGIVEVSSPLCHFGGDGAITLTAVQGGTPPYVVALNGGSSAPVVSFPVVFDNLTFGFHTLTIIDALGVITTQEVFMPDAPVLQVDLDGPYTVPLGNSVVLGAGSASQIATWSWSPPDYLSCTDCPKPLCTPRNDIVYTIAVTDLNGCTAEGELTVFVEKVEQVYVPNAFSPNNDGINDELTVFAGPQVDKIKSFQIFDRWGELVFEYYNFEPNDLQLGWTGTYKDKELDPAVFVWYAEVVFLDGQVRLFKGGVSLIK
ncbi:MAG: gliding motility-associated C-terminal domain-containing protein [Saprospiraceae bacterium]|nr:gliding motility-associated C-terminal domain-containing protein [Saprospiraceae bacterium]MCF8251023.1 gliding motility-associated C-terminal domain-containing protein [Saprospiraceae bacterium]MCF8281479.1 gliding motility-associated C-terminal domain-containing protein [Bacteroidales bacterium]MCF8311620.1 gliding motility-associated C-terminal domain-containing protein [Saprospiraceae bacterium]MCF8440961.1 gliding motility-associated C-terminal domain-containing protein [Saprospiraceae 